MENKFKLGAAVLFAYAEYLETVKSPVSKVQITPGVNYVIFEKEYHASNTESADTKEAREPINMVKRFEFSVYSNGIAYVKYWVYMKHEGHCWFDDAAKKDIIDATWSVSNVAATRKAVKRMMTILRKNDARLEAIQTMLDRSNQARIEMSSKLRADIFRGAATAWNTPLPEGQAGRLFETAFRK